MDYYLRQVASMLLVSTLLLTGSHGQNVAEENFISRNNNDESGRSFLYNHIDAWNPTPIDDFRRHEPFHDIYTLKGKTGETQRIHFAVDDHGLRANIHSNAVNLNQNMNPDTSYFGYRLSQSSYDGLVPVSKNVEGYSKTSLDVRSSPVNMDAMQDNFVPPPVGLLTPLVPSKSPQASMSQLYSEDENLHNSEYVRSVSNLPIFPFDQRYDSQRILKPVKPGYVPTVESVQIVPKTTVEYIPKLNKLQNLQMMFNIPKKDMQIFGSRTINSNATSHTDSNVVTPLTSNSKNIDILSTGKTYAMSQKFLTQALINGHKSKVSSDTILKNDTNIGYYVDDVIKNKQKNTLTPLKFKPPKSKLTVSEGLSDQTSFSKSLIFSPMSTIFDNSNENGQYYRYVMNLGRNSENYKNGKAKVFSTGNALYKILNETGINFQPDSVPFPNETPTYIRYNNFSKTAKSSVNLSHEINKMNSEELDNNLKSNHLETAEDVIDASKIVDVTPSNNLSNLITYNNESRDIYDGDVSKIIRIMNYNETHFPTVKMTSQSPQLELESSTLNMNTFNTSSFLDDLFENHTKSKDEKHFEMTPESVSDVENEATPMYITIPEVPTGLKFVTSSKVHVSNSTVLEDRNENEDNASIHFEESITPLDFSFEVTAMIDMEDYATSTTTKEEDQFLVSVETSTPIPITTISLNPLDKETPISIKNITYSEISTNLSISVNTTAAPGILEHTAIDDLTKSEFSASGTNTTDEISDNVPETSQNVNVSIILGSNYSVPAENVFKKSIKKYLGNADENKHLADKNQQPMLELVIQSSEMSDFMSKIHNMPILIRVLNPKNQTQMKTEINSEIKQNDIESLQEIFIANVSSDPELISNHVQIRAETGKSSQLREDSSKNKSTLVLKKIENETKDGNKFLTRNQTIDVTNNYVNGTEAIVESGQYEGKNVSEPTSNTQNTYYEDNSTMVTTLRTGIYANADPSSTNAPLQLIPIFFESEQPATPEESQQIVEFDVASDNKSSPIPLSDNYLSVEHFYAGNLTNIESQNAAYNGHKPQPPMHFVDIFRYPVLKNSGEGFNLFSESSVNDDIDKYLSSDNLTNVSFNNDLHRNGYDLSPAVEYEDLLSYNILGNDIRGLEVAGDYPTDTYFVLEDYDSLPSENVNRQNDYINSGYNRNQERNMQQQTLFPVATQMNDKPIIMLEKPSQTFGSRIPQEMSPEIDSFQHTSPIFPPSSDIVSYEGYE